MPPPDSAATPHRVASDDRKIMIKTRRSRPRGGTALSSPPPSPPGRAAPPAPRNPTVGRHARSPRSRPASGRHYAGRRPGPGAHKGGAAAPRTWARAPQPQDGGREPRPPRADTAAAGTAVRGGAPCAETKSRGAPPGLHCPALPGSRLPPPCPTCRAHLVLPLAAEAEARRPLLVALPVVRPRLVRLKFHHRGGDPPAAPGRHGSSPTAPGRRSPPPRAPLGAGAGERPALGRPSQPRRTAATAPAAAPRHGGPAPLAPARPRAAAPRPSAAAAAPAPTI